MLAAHRGLGAKLVDFAGWDMPLQYEGTVFEHRAVRTTAGVFDVSHLGKLRVSGDNAGAALQATVTADVEGLAPGRATYALVLDDHGGCIDDVFVYRLDRQAWLVVPNAANVEAVGGALAESGATPEDEWDRWAILALQGPRSFDVFQAVFPASTAIQLRLHAFERLDVFGEEAVVARTGYTGEKGFELYIPATVAGRAFERLIEHAAPAGLGARDTLRLEMGYALYGHELTREINPLEAGLSWAIAWDKPFRGRDALLEVRSRGAARKLVGVRCTTKGVPRQGHQVIAGDETIAEVTSGNFSPTLSTGIALALGPRRALSAVDAPVAIRARTRRIEGIIVKPPFVERGRAA